MITLKIYESVRTPTPYPTHKKQLPYSYNSFLSIGTNYRDFGTVVPHIVEHDTDLTQVEPGDFIVKDCSISYSPYNSYNILQVVEPYNGKYVLVSNGKETFNIYVDRHVKWEKYHKLDNDINTNINEDELENVVDYDAPTAYETGEVEND